MDILKPTTLTWWQLGLLKWAVLFIGIAVGATWPDVFRQYVGLLLVVGLVISCYLGSVWFRNK